MRFYRACFWKIMWYQQFWPFWNDNYLPKNLAICKLAPYFCEKRKRLEKDKLIQELFQKIEVLTSRLEQAETQIAVLELENTELKARLNSNSKNSSRPPSSDGYRKQPAFPKKKKGKQGGQAGHKGNTLHQVDNPDKIVSCKPNSCSCGHDFKEEELILSEKRHWARDSSISLHIP